MGVAPVDDRIKVPTLGFLAIALVSLAFVVGAFDALLTNHFSSWNRLTIQPEDELARTLESLMPIARFVSMAGAATFGYTTLRRVSYEGLKRGAIRLGVIAFSPIIVELADFETQDGQVPDLDKLPIHSMILLAILIFGPALAALWDAITIRRYRMRDDASEPAAASFG